LIQRGCVVKNNIPKLREVIKILKKTEKRNEKDVVHLVPLLQELKFFKERKPMNTEELQEVCQNIQHLQKEPGEIVF
jgi:hypothetical protein